MDFPDNFYTILVLFVLTLLLNLPFGYARARSKKYSFRWFLFIHAPIPIIFIIRTFSHVQMKYIPVFFVAAVIGQVIGGKLEL